MKLEEGLLPRVVAAVFNFCDCRIEEKIKQPERLQREHEEKKHSEDEHLALYLKYDELLAELVALSWVSIQEKMDLSDSAQRKRDVVHVLLLEEEKKPCGVEQLVEELPSSYLRCLPRFYSQVLARVISYSGEKCGQWNQLAIQQ